ncbi:MAG: hypothetical protein AAFR39_03900 [Pseudomonadota bacterium]
MNKDRLTQRSNTPMQIDLPQIVSDDTFSLSVPLFFKPDQSPQANSITEA